MNNANLGMYLIGHVFLAVIIVLVLREVFCWYWKINTAVGLLTEIRDGISALNAANGGRHHFPGSGQSNTSILAAGGDDEESHRRRHEAWKAKGI